MLTAGSITDEQIRELRDAVAVDALYQGYNIRALCRAALKLYGPDRNGTRATARARCAEILKARALAEHPACDCGAVEAVWRGPEDGLRVYRCDACWARQGGA